jgi:uncharacterized membrane-anchored protein
MQTMNVPALGWRYWVLISLASVFGANMGDFVSHVLGLGHARGLPVLAVVFGVVLLAERRARVGSEAYYWLAIVAVRTAATNLADLCTHDLRLGYEWVIAGLALLLVLTVLSGRLVAASVEARRAIAPESVPETDPRYWTAMLTAGTLGTALGDYAAGGLGVGASSIAFVALLAVVLAFGHRADTELCYWLTIVIIRTAGTNVGDFLAGRDGLDLGLRVSTACTGLLLLGTALVWRQRPDAASAVPSLYPIAAAAKTRRSASGRAP